MSQHRLLYKSHEAPVFSSSYTRAICTSQSQAHSLTVPSSRFYQVQLTESPDMQTLIIKVAFLKPFLLLP